MHCDEITMKLDRYMEGDLRATERLLVDVHLAQCHACRQTLAAYRELNETVARIIAHPEPSNDFDALLARIHADDAARAENKTVDHTREPLGHAVLIGRRFALAAGVLVIAGLSAAWFERDRFAGKDAAAHDAPTAIQSLSERTDRMLEDAEAGDPEPTPPPRTSDGNAPF